MKRFKQLQQNIPLVWKLIISMTVIVVIFIFGNSLVKSQDAEKGDFAVKMDVTVSSVGYTEGEDLAVFIDWTTAEENDYGYKVEREYRGEKEDILILNPFPLGIDNLSNGGQFLDDDVKLGETYTYYIYAFDRAGNIAEPAKVTATVAREEFEKANLCDLCVDDEVQEDNE